MFQTVIRLVLITLFISGAQLVGQSSPNAASGNGRPSVRHLVATRETQVAGEPAGTLSDPLKCDEDGNIYYLVDPGGASALQKLNLKGEHVTQFRPQANPDMPIDLALDFALTPSGEVYMLVFPHQITRYVFSYKSDGSYRSAIKLDPGFPWSPAALAVFPSGGFLITGRRYERDDKNALVLTPFTGVFSADGVLLKEVKLKDDDDLYDMAASGDPRVVSAGNPTSNLAIDLSRMEVGDDGNLYLMRWTNPLIIYGISPGGEVVRRFTVDPENADFHPVTMHIAGHRIAILFTKGAKDGDLVEVVDLEGHHIATYSEKEAEDGKGVTEGAGTAFACYASNPERFIFISIGENNRLGIETVEPR